MKKAISVIFIFTLCFFTVGCSKKQTDTKPCLKGISFTAELDCFGESCEADVDINGNGSMCIKVTAPESIKGLSLTVTDDGMSAEYLGLKYNCNSFSDSAAYTALYKTFKSAQADNAAVTEDGGKFYISAEYDKTEYKLYLSGTGLPLSAEGDNGFKAVFKNVTVKNQVSQQNG